VQSAGYLIVAVGPLAVGLLHQATGGWGWPLVFLLIASTVPVAIAGVVAARPRYFEDERAS
jgi:MFS transporter, CP family, cyanate transporter